MKVTITPQKQTKKARVAAFIAQKHFQRHIDDNPEFFKDLHDLSAEIAHFNVKWGSVIHKDDLPDIHKSAL